MSIFLVFYLAKRTVYGRFLAGNVKVLSVVCSIIGWIGKTGSVTTTMTAEVQHLLDAMHHRGPDAARMRACSGSTTLASNRLRITDHANPQADMPLVSADGRYTIVLNGEIYNHEEIRRMLPDYPFTTHSDTETLLAAYMTWGRACLDTLEGMYAFCLHDAQTDTTFVACDPTGQKMVYVYEDDSAFVLASEIQPLITNPYRRKDWDLDGMAEFVAQRYILGGNTHIRQIRKIDSGTWVEFSPEGFTEGRFYRIPLGDQTRSDVDTITQDIRTAVQEGCARTFHLEVPYGLLLSGGIDSTAVLAEAVRQKLPMKTFSIGFKLRNVAEDSESVLDEFDYSRELARFYGTEHTEIVLNEALYCDYLDRWAEMVGEPLGSQEAACLIRLFEECQKHMRVVFCGSGPDEVYDGYSCGKDLQNVAYDALPEAFFHAFGWIGSTDLRKLMPYHDACALTTTKYRETLALYPDVTDPLQAVQLLHFHGRLRSYEFRQMDMISMKFSIEARSPLADRDFMKVAFDFDPKLKQWQSEKGIYKHALQGVVPEFIAKRKKEGFPIPSEMWFSDEFEARARIVLADDSILVGCGLLDKTYLHELWAQKDPNVRNIFSRLYTLEKILRLQAPHVGTEPLTELAA